MKSLKKFAVTHPELGLSILSESQYRNVGRLIPTGIDALDAYIVGIPPWTELYGAPGCGKTTLALHIMKSATNNGIPVIYMDCEEPGFIPERARKIGVNLDCVYVCYPEFIEQGFETIREVARHWEAELKPPLVIWDTVSFCPTQAELEGKKVQMNERAALIRKLIRGLGTKTQANFLMMNHVIQNIGGYGETEVTPGGSSIKYKAILRLHLYSGKKWTSPKSREGKGKDIRVGIDKSRICVPGQKITLPLDYVNGYLPYHALMYQFCSPDADSVDKDSPVCITKGNYKIKKVTKAKSKDEKEEILSAKWDTLQDVLSKNPLTYKYLLSELQKKVQPEWKVELEAQLKKDYPDCWEKCFGKLDCKAKDKRKCILPSFWRLGRI